VRSTDYLNVLSDIEDAETVDELRGALVRLERRLERAGELRDPDDRGRAALARLDERARDLAVIEALLAGLG